MTLSSPCPSTVSEAEIPQACHHSVTLAVLSRQSNSNWAGAGSDYSHLLSVILTVGTFRLPAFFNNVLPESGLTANAAQILFLNQKPKELEDEFRQRTLP